ncbi:MAG: hypothetical protein QG674_274 [Patescibacteria group bacterium]|jgi:hypothetical protein|nr:hypothetical protein [Patescibacteria group bacterium]
MINKNYLLAVGALLAVSSIVSGALYFLPSLMKPLKKEDLQFLAKAIIGFSLLLGFAIILWGLISNKKRSKKMLKQWESDLTTGSRA